MGERSFPFLFFCNVVSSSRLTLRVGIMRLTLKLSSLIPFLYGMYLILLTYATPNELWPNVILLQLCFKLLEEETFVIVD